MKLLFTNKYTVDSVITPIKKLFEDLGNVIEFQEDVVQTQEILIQEAIVKKCAAEAEVLRADSLRDKLGDLLGL